MTKRWTTVIAALIPLWTIGCAAGTRSPEPIPVDHVECARCGMLISSDAGGGEIVSPSDDVRFYDDIACLAADWTARQTGAHAFVRLPGGRWADAESIAYARPRDVNTAMGSGIIAFGTAAEAQAADRDGRAFTLEGIARSTGERP